MHKDTKVGTSIFFLVVSCIAAFVSSIVYFASGGPEVIDTRVNSEITTEMQEPIKTRVMASLESSYDAMILSGNTRGDSFYNRGSYSRNSYDVNIGDLHKAVAAALYPQLETFTSKEVISPKHASYKFFGVIASMCLVLSCVFGFLGSELYETIIERRRIKTEHLAEITRQEKQQFKDWKKYVERLHKLVDYEPSKQNKP